MAKNGNIIELNGMRYDATTGRLLSNSPKPASKAGVQKTAATRKPAASKPKQSAGVHMDGFSTKRVSRQSAPARPLQRATQPSKTLMRKYVQKPSAPKAATTKTTATHKAPAKHKNTAAPIASTPTPSILRTNTDPMRIVRAAHIKQSNLVSKFGGALRNTVTPITAVLPVKQAPVELETSHVAPAITPTHHGTIFDKALDSATSHQHPKMKKRRITHRVAKKLRMSPKALNISAGVLSLVVLGGFISYQNMPNMTMRVATARSGVKGSLPSYTPSGFGIAGRVKYTPGQISMTYQARSDDRAFTITQKNSDWNSETLLQNFVATSTQPFQMRQDNGKTVYLYGDNNATWVDGGVWYQIEGKASLSSDQLIRIIDSL